MESGTSNETCETVNAAYGLKHTPNFLKWPYPWILYYLWKGKSALFSDYMLKLCKQSPWMPFFGRPKNIQGSFFPFTEKTMDLRGSIHQSLEKIHDS